MANAQAKSKQFAHVSRRSGVLREAFAEKALVAGTSIAVMFQPRHQARAQGVDVDAVERISRTSRSSLIYAGTLQKNPMDASNVSASS
jgi:hypothetical protein